MSTLLQALLPRLPDEKVQMKLTGLAGDATLRIGHLVYRWFKQIYTDHTGGRMLPSSNILDFGCGWGRVIRFFLKDVAPQGLWGADCVSGSIEMCRQTNPWVHFRLVNPWPPSTFGDSIFDLIFCNSVFSHFNEEIHEKWLAEFRRILRPGGLLMATTWPREFIEERERIIQEYPEWMRPPAAFIDKQKYFEDYDSGKYCYSPVAETGIPILDPFFGEACISRQYVLNRWTRYFEFVDFIADDTSYPQRNSYHQNAIVVRRPAGN